MSARNANHSLAGIIVTAPADITINIKRSGGCDTLITLDTASYTRPCAGPYTFTTYSVFNSLNTNGGNMYFTTGVFKVYFTVADNCGNSGIDSMLVSVYDASSPNVICNPQMTMNLPSYGFLDAPAWIFDAGSSDGCGHVYFKVKRMFAPSGYSCFNPGNPNNAFDDQIRFCCEDVDSTSIMVIFRVYDIQPGLGPVNDALLSGRFVDCMVQAIVLDKIPPDIDCPKNITVQCGVYLDSILANNSDPIVSDNCGLDNVRRIITKNLNACGSGIINSTFIATDKHGQMSSCTQVITVLKLDTFNGLDPAQLKWPVNKTVYACRINSDTINSGIPEIREDGCANVLTAHHDEKYNFDRGGVCAKILRYWEVIDWCKYNPGLIPNPKIASNGYYKYTQIIMILDTIAPVLSGLKDTIIGIQSPSCQSGPVTLPTVVATDCGSSSNISIHYEVDLNNDGHIDFIGQGGNASGNYPIGRHHLKFYANDSCHNTGTLDITLEVIDSKPPNVNAIFGLSSSLIQMQAGPMVSINARLFNEKSTDNCTNKNELRFSFSSDINDTSRVFTCDSLGLRIIQLFVWDLAGNSSEVSTFISILDVDNLCPTGLKGVQLSGQIRTSKDEVIKGAEVNLSYDNIEKHAITDDNGYFVYNSIPNNKIVKLKTSFNKHFIDGISTADIIKIQRHILGIELFKTPEDILAADVDLSRTITAKDIVWLRKLILGQITEIPNQDSYIFIDKKYNFSSPQNPFNEIDSCKQVLMATTNGNNRIDLLGIKLGDVNHSFKANGLQFKYPKQFNLKYKLSDGALEIFPAEYGSIDGFQFELDNRDLCLEPWSIVRSDLENWSETNYRVDGNIVRISYSQNVSFSIDQKLPLLRIPLHYLNENCVPYIFLNTEFQNEIYQNDVVYTIKNIDFIPTENMNEAESIDIYPNPFSNQLQIQIKIAVESMIHVEVYSMDLKKIYSNVFNLQKGENSVVLAKEELSGCGMCIMHIRSTQSSRIFKIINE